VRLTASVAVSDQEPGPGIDIELPASPCLAGIVEVEPRPVDGARLMLDVRSDASDGIDVYDLFVISNG
jgi:hypothetical protein